MATSIWSEKELQILKENYETLSSDKISELLNRSAAAIRWKAQDIGLKANVSLRSKKYTFNEDFFASYTSNNCYIAGLIAADGSINTEKNSLWFFQSKPELVGYIKDNLKSNNEVYFRERENTKEYSILFTSEKLVSDINRNFLIKDRKSFLGLEVPPIKNLELALCYIAGLIDGDGSISYKKASERGRNILSFTLLASKEILNWINLLFTTNKLDDKGFIYHRRNDCKVELYKLYGTHNRAINFLSPIYYALLKNDIPISEKFLKVKEAII